MWLKQVKNFFWIFIIMFIPGIGAAIYFFTQILPEIGQSRTVNTAKNSLIKAIDPQRELRKKKDQLALANTLDNKLKLAEECFEANMLDDAIELFQSCLTGLGEGDADTMIKLAQAYFTNKDFQLAIDLLNQIKKENPNYKSTDGHLLYARSLEKLDQTKLAIEEYAIVADNYPGEEGRVRYALFLLKTDQHKKAKEIFQQVIDRSKLAPKFYQKKESHWIKMARNQLKDLN